MIDGSDGSKSEELANLVNELEEEEILLKKRILVFFNKIVIFAKKIIYLG